MASFIPLMIRIGQGIRDVAHATKRFDAFRESAHQPDVTRKETH